MGMSHSNWLQRSQQVNTLQTADSKLNVHCKNQLALLASRLKRWAFVTLLLFLLPTAASALYDAEDGTTTGWSIFDSSPAGANIFNTFDSELDSNVISFESSGLANGFRLGGTSAANGLTIEDTWLLSWQMRATSSYRIYIAATTANGFRYFSFSERDTSTGLSSNARHIFIGLGNNTTTGDWISIERDLSQDLATLEPGNTLLAVHGFLVRGTLSLDNIQFSEAPPEIEPPTEPIDSDPTSFDAENGSIQGWTVYDASPPGASINVSQNAELGSQVYELSGTGTLNGFRLGGTSASTGFSITDKPVISWQQLTSESFRIYIAITTSNGFRYMSYSESNNSRGLSSNGRHIFLGLGEQSMSGQWVTIERNLVEDLATFEPGNTLLAIHGFLVRGSMSLDNIRFLDASELANIPPIASAGADKVIDLGDPITLNGSLSSDPDGSIASYRWSDAQDNELGSDATLTITPVRAGEIVYTLTVTDNLGLTHTDSVTISILQRPSNPEISGYQLVFNDEFNDDANSGLNPEKWDTGLLWGPYFPINNEEQLYVDTLGMHAGYEHTPFEFTGSTLKITATAVDANTQPPPRPPENDPVWMPRPYSEYRYNGPTDDGLGYKEEDVNYLSGIMTSYGSFRLTHGYVEMRAKLPAGRGLWPAFWLLNTHYVEAVPEIDVMEFLGQDTDKLYNTYHYFDIADGWRKISTPSFPVFADDWTQDFHTFGVAWGPKEIIWYVDGEETHRVTDADYNISGQAMYLIANLAVGGDWPGAPDTTTVFPAEFEIDYIRAYKRQLTPQLNLAEDYQIMFEDDFSGTSLDADKWNTHFRWGPYLPINNEEQYYVDALGSDASDKTPFTITDGVLSITARKVSDINSYAIPQALPNINNPIWRQFPSFQRNTAYSPEDYAYTSGIITSFDAFKFAHGYAEIRAKVPQGNGLSPAFWLLNGYNVAQQPEIDIMEMRGRIPTQVVHTYNRRVNGVMQATGTMIDGGTNYAESFHTYGVRWQPGKIDWYIDGAVTHSYENDDVAYQLMYVLANLAVGGDFDQIAVDEDLFPVSLDIDYIRVYQELHKE